MIVLVMGVSGAGKTTIGEALAARLGWPYLDADDYHPPENVAKMASGTPLEDADRWPWLERMNAELRKQRDAVLGCSGLKESYRRLLARGIDDFRIVYLHGTPELLRERVASRKHRYMPASLLASQLATLEPPQDAIAIDVAEPVERSVDRIVRALEA